ncbi:UNKNOWN [Stylonychia lemnae]|uniref:Uncharacterized protein n=1 Tax=Stylonychia lemnae TaxID=5949 RepID=A0A078A8F3_STYLE|nr:UNKNOWN [Stylonychia lemnae]|eukprot:CDW78540.1 UNKNOWN [Stylonychia lemnae]
MDNYRTNQQKQKVHSHQSDDDQNNNDESLDNKEEQHNDRIDGKKSSMENNEENERFQYNSMDNSISYMENKEKTLDQETSYDDDYNIIRKKSTLNNNPGQVTEGGDDLIRVQNPDNQKNQNYTDLSTLQQLNEMEELKNKLLEYKVDVTKLLGSGSPKAKFADPAKFKVQDAVNFNSLFMNKELKSQSLIKSQSTKEIKLPKINNKKSLLLKKEELEYQKKIVGKIINDKDYILSMEYLKEEPNLYDMKMNPHSLRASLMTMKSSMIEQDKQKKSFIQSIKQQSMKAAILPKKQLRAFNPVGSQNLKSSSMQDKFDKFNGSHQQTISKSNSQPYLHSHEQHHIKKDHAQLSNGKDGPNEVGADNVQSPLNITKAYQEFIDTNREGRNQKDLSHIIMRNGGNFTQSQNLEVTSTQNTQLKSHLSVGTLRERSGIHSHSEMNLFRQKLNSSNGRKHFLVAYEMTKILRDNKLELECNDYKKIKEIITDMSKKRFETRSNSIKKSLIPNQLSIQEAEELTKKLNLLAH